MRIEHHWFSPSTAADWETKSRQIVVNAAAPSSTEDGSHAFGTVAIGHSGKIDMPEATGRFIAISMETGKPIVYTHHTAGPERPTPDAKDLGVFNRDAMALVCVPTRPLELTRGYGGLSNSQITASQLGNS